MFLILFVTLNGGMQISEKALAKSHVTQNQAQVADKDEIAGMGPNVTDKKSDINGDDITIIGDSLMINVEPVLQNRLPGIVIDAQLGRQMYQAPDLISKLQKEGKLGKIVIIELGTNGTFTEKQLMNTLDSLQRTEKIFLVNTRVPKPWESVVNEALAKATESYSNTKLIDWHLISSGHEDYFYPDGVHLTQSGMKAYEETLIEALISNQNDGE